MTWQTSSFAVLALVLIGAFAWYERRRPPARVVALVAALAALAVVGRLAFAAFPNVVPTTDIVLFAGFALGAIPGFVVGAVTALASNVFLGQGPWTAWQMVAWGGVGVIGAGLAAVLRARVPGRFVLAAVCGVAGLAFGAFMDLYQWTLAARQDAGTYAAISVSSLPYNLAHAVGNVAFCLVIGPAFLRALERYRRRFEIEWAPVSAAGAAGPAAAASVVLALAVATGLTVASGGDARAAEPRAGAAAAGGAVVPNEPGGATSSSGAMAAQSGVAGRAAAYLARAQNRDGGFGSEPGDSSDQLFTGWAALGAAAAGRNPRDLARSGGRTLTHYLRSEGSIRDTGELERTILVLHASGLSPRRFGDRDLVAELLRRRGGDGSWQGNVAYTAFGVLALRAAGRSPGSAAVSGSAEWLERARNGDGGFGVVPQAESDVDNTAAVLQVLAATGRAGGPAARGAARYLRRAQNRDGGFGLSDGRSSNAQSTAWAVQGLVAVGRGGVGRALRYLAGLQRADGHISYSRSSDQTPVWVTAQALTALRRRPFPIGAVARAPRGSRPAGPSATAAPRPGASDGGVGATAEGSGGGEGSGSEGGEGAGGGGKDKGRRDARGKAGSLLPPGSADAARAAADEPLRTEAAAERDADGGGGPAVWVWLVAAAGSLALLWLLRHRLRALGLPPLLRRRARRPAD